ncbi:MAG TPA: PaaI family thioesterase [Roseiarcus sp.]|nr:PaaI family thioesterase [Roseiarcus sp.]
MTNADATVYGVARPEDVAALSGRQVLQAMIDGRLPAPPIARTLGFLLTEVEDGFAVFEGDTGSHLLNPMGTVHGGWALTIIDSVTGCAAYSVLPSGVGYTTVETKANFTRPILADTGRVRAEGRVVSRGRQIVTAEAKVTDARGRVLAHGTSTLLVLGGARA